VTRSKPISRRELLSHLARLSACDPAVEWVKRTKGTPAQLWAKCPDATWSLWLAGRAEVGRKAVVLAACDCARLALPYTTDPRVLACIKTTEAWCRGEATIEQVRQAQRGAWAAYAAASAAAAYADAYAAAAYAADAAAAADHAAAYAADAARAAANAAAAAAAYAARAAAAHDADAADAYATAAANAANAAAAARASTLRKCASLVRKRIPWSVMCAALRAS
jgi:hypothetical protein